ncbi:hypothetical protein SKAU_G00138400 [Synaphobranchus kaupii]|uniref:Uncharacterized protein n=1 Tax=Synaphobranchus kaupii TaxID=118154 RepID=A0A9Q1FS77_SYNKA|nr:hypothetical protein SKAU_G00138400 [Synaphobranchus kaupii]
MPPKTTAARQRYTKKWEAEPELKACCTPGLSLQIKSSMMLTTPSRPSIICAMDLWNTSDADDTPKGL